MVDKRASQEVEPAIDNNRAVQQRDDPIRRASHEIDVTNTQFRNLQKRELDTYSALYDTSVALYHKASSEQYRSEEREVLQKEAVKFFTQALKFNHLVKKNREILNQKDPSHQDKARILDEFREIEEVKYPHQYKEKVGFEIRDPVVPAISIHNSKVSMQTELSMSQRVTFKEARDNGWMCIRLPDSKGHGFIHEFTLKNTQEGSDISNLSRFEPVVVASPPGAEDPEIKAYKSNNTNESLGDIPDFTVLPCVKNSNVNDRVLVYLPDNQEVWVKENEVRPYEASSSTKENSENISDTQIGIVNKPSISFYHDRESHEASGEFYVLTKLSLPKDYAEEQGRVPVISPKGEKLWINRDDIDLRSQANPFPRQSMTKADELGQALLDRKTPFRWGGATPGTGYDCSKYLRTCMLMAGVELPLNSRDQFDFIKTDQANFRLVAQHENPAHKNINSTIAPFTASHFEEAQCGDIVFFHFPINDKGKIIRNGEEKPTSYRVMYNGFVSKDGKFLHSEGTRYNAVTKSTLACFPDQARNDAEVYTTSAHYFTIMRPLWYYNEDIKGTIPGTKPGLADIQHHFAETTEFFKGLFGKAQDDELLRDVSPRVKEQYMNLVAGAELSQNAIAKRISIEEATGVFRTCTENLMGIKIQLENYIQNHERPPVL